MLLMVKKGIRGGICHYIYRYAKANNKYRRIIIKIKNRHIFNIGIYIVYMGGEMIAEDITEDVEARFESKKKYKSS